MNINLNLDGIDSGNDFLIRQIFGQIKYVMSMYSADFAYNKISYCILKFPYRPPHHYRKFKLA